MTNAIQMSKDLAEAREQLKDAEEAVILAVADGRAPDRAAVAALRDRVAELGAALPIVAQRDWENARTAKRQPESIEELQPLAEDLDRALQALGDTYRAYSSAAQKNRRAQRLLGLHVAGAFLRHAPELAEVLSVRRIPAAHRRTMTEAL